MLQQRHVNHAVKIPTWPELAVVLIWPSAQMFPDFLKYVPDEWRGGPRADRSFFYTVLQTLAPEYVSALLQECRELRDQRKVKASLGANLTSIQAQFLGPLLQGPFNSDCK